MGQPIRREWFGQQLDYLAFVVSEGFSCSGVPGDEQEPNLGPHLSKPNRQFRAAHSRHHDVAHQQIYPSGSGGQLDRFSRVAGLEHGVAVGAESEHGQPPNAWVVLDHQHGLCPG